MSLCRAPGNLAHLPVPEPPGASAEPCARVYADGRACPRPATHTRPDPRPFRVAESMRLCKACAAEHDAVVAGELDKTTAARRRLAPHLTTRQGIAAHLAGHPGATSDDLRDALGRSRAVVGTALLRMIQRGEVRRETDPDLGRYRHWLTTGEE